MKFRIAKKVMKRVENSGSFSYKKSTIAEATRIMERIKTREEATKSL